MKLKAEATPYSSVVGGGLTLVDERGRARFLVVIMGTTEGITRDQNAAITNVLVDLLDKRGAFYVPEKAGASG